MPALQCAGSDDRILLLPGFEADPAAIPLLTIDYSGLRDVWLPSARLEAQACEEADNFADVARRFALDTARSQVRRDDWERTFHARSFLLRVARRHWAATVEQVRSRGGLLHIGCAV